MESKTAGACKGMVGRFEIRVSMNLLCSCGRSIAQKMVRNWDYQPSGIL